MLKIVPRFGPAVVEKENEGMCVKEQRGSLSGGIDHTVESTVNSNTHSLLRTSGALAVFKHETTTDDGLALGNVAMFRPKERGRPKFSRQDEGSR